MTSNSGWLPVVALAIAGTPAMGQESIVVTATRTPEPELTTPVADTLVSGQDARNRGAIDLRGALSRTAGIEVLPGSDQGPSSSVVAMQGLTELDAYLLVVDGVPYGGAFNPATPTLDLFDFDRIEVVRGAAPVAFGATSFVGVIHVIHADAGAQSTRGLAQAGTKDSGFAAFTTGFSSRTIGQSLLTSLEHRGFSQDRSEFSRAHLLYRAAANVGGGRFHFDLDGTILNAAPYSPHPVDGSGLSDAFQRDANVNPRDAVANQRRIQANFGYDTRIGSLNWSTIMSGDQTSARNIRGFLRHDFDLTPLGESNADGFRQRVRTMGAYLDTHLSDQSPILDWVVGADWLYGRGQQHSANFEYSVLPNGSSAPRSASLNIDESTLLKDNRSFGGLYAQGIVRPTAALTLLGGIRLNRTVERRCGGEAQGSETPTADECQARRKTRFAGSMGASYAFWRSATGALVGFADYRNTYKPAAIDFGPEAEPDILKPETAHTLEAGLKAQALDGRLHVQGSYFDTSFQNLVIRENIHGLPGLANAGKQRFRGLEIETEWSPIAGLWLSASYAHHIARFTDFEVLADDGFVRQLAGNRLQLSPKCLASAVAAYAPNSGLQASATLRYVGSRFLDRENMIKASSYVTADARAGWKLKSGWGIFVEGQNIFNRRDPVTESELGEGQYYLLSGRRILATLSFGR